MNPVEEYIENQPDELRGLFHHLRWLILSKHDNVTESIQFKVPFFKLEGKNWMYINPTKKGLDVSFLNGTRLIDIQHLLRIDGRKMVGSYRVESLETLNQAELEFILNHSIHHWVNKS